MNKFLIILFLVTSPVKGEEILCPNVNKEGSWSIPEKEFNEKNALESLKNLEHVIKEGPAEKGLGYIDVENDLIIVKGYTLKKFIGKDGWGTERFCQFLKYKAELQH